MRKAFLVMVAVAAVIIAALSRRKPAGYELTGPSPLRKQRTKV